MEHSYNIVATGSSGNCIIIDDIISFDMGIPFNKVFPYYKKLKIIFITHKHSDHLRKPTIKKLAYEKPTLKFCVGSYLVQELVDLGVNPKNIYVVDINNKYDMGNFIVEPYELFHDVPNQAFKLTFKKDNYQILYAVDTASLEKVNAKNCDLYLVERKL